MELELVEGSVATAAAAALASAATKAKVQTDRPSSQQSKDALTFENSIFGVELGHRPSWCSIHIKGEDRKKNVLAVLASSYKEIT